MPRLLLVDENPSIRRSAEILLGGSDVELVSVASAEEALEQLQAGEPFHVALIHAFLPGTMDGWQLLAQLRANPATARMPIAMMAGVLKEVDPVQIAEAPIQGFLRKPIELGNLRERVSTILSTPVPEPVPPAAPPTVAFEAESESPFEETFSHPEIRAEEAPMERDDDLLILEIQDLFPGDTVPAAPPEELAAIPIGLDETPGEDSLELEELDLDALRSLELSQPPAPEWPQPTPQHLPSEPEVQPTWEEVPEPAFSPVVDFNSEMTSDLLDGIEASEGTVALPDLASDLDLPLHSDLDLSDMEEALPPLLGAVDMATPPLELEPFPTPGPEAPAASFVEPLPPPAAMAAPVGDARALVQALVADPAALDALCRAVVAELGDRALKEIAWEILPDLAEKMRK